MFDDAAHEEHVLDLSRHVVWRPADGADADVDAVQRRDLLREGARVLDQIDLPRPLVGLSVGDALRHQLGRRGQEDDFRPLGRDGIDHSLKLVVGFGGRDHQEGLASGLSLKRDEGRQRL